MATGNFENEYTLGHGSGCDRINNTEYFQQKYTIGAAAMEFTSEEPTRNRRLSYGAKIMMGTHNEIRISDQYETNKTLFGVTPYINWDSNWLGVGGGLHLGNLSYVYENLNNDGTGRPESGSNWVPIYPQVYFRLGPQKWFFADYHLADQFPSALPGYRQLVGIGTGLGQTNGTRLRFGSNTSNLLYLSGTFVFKDKFVIEPLYMWGRSPYDPGSDIFSQFSLGVSYRFGFQDAKKPAGYSLDKTYKSNIKY